MPKQEKQKEHSDDSEEYIYRGVAYDLTEYGTMIELLRTTVSYTITCPARGQKKRHLWHKHCNLKEAMIFMEFLNPVVTANAKNAYLYSRRMYRFDDTVDGQRTRTMDAGGQFAG